MSTSQAVAVFVFGTAIEISGFRSSGQLVIGDFMANMNLGGERCTDAEFFRIGNLLPFTMSFPITTFH